MGRRREKCVISELDAERSWKGLSTLSSEGCLWELTMLSVSPGTKVIIRLANGKCM